VSEEKKESAAPETKQKGSKKKAPAGQEKPPRSAKKRILICAIVFVVCLFAGNPIGEFLNKLTAGITVISLDWSDLFRLVLMLAALLLIAALASLFFTRWQPKTNHGRTMATLASSATRYILALVGILWGLAILGVDVSALLAGAGVVALIIGFGAESLIADVITGIFMLFEHQYEVGDIIVVGDFRGTVTQIGIRTTSITDAGGNVKIINNSDVRNLINRSAQASRAVCDLGVTYDGNTVRQAEAVLDTALKKVYEDHKDLFKAVPEYLGVQELNLSENAAILRIVADVEESDIFKAQRVLNHDLLLALEDAGVSNPPLEVLVENAK